MFRTIWVYINACWYVITHLFIIRKKYKNPKQYTIDEKFAEAKELNRVIINSSGIELIIEGKENLKYEPVLYVSNHASMFDPYLVAMSVGRQMGAVIAGDEWYDKIPVISRWFKLFGSVYLNRKNAKESIKAINEASDNIQKGHSMLIFPEGEITRFITDDCVGEFKGGSFKIATKAKAPIIPIAIIGANDVYKAHGIFGKLYKKQVIVKILEPYTLHLESSVKTSQIASEIKELIKQEVEEKSAILKAEEMYSRATS